MYVRNDLVRQHIFDIGYSNTSRIYTKVYTDDSRCESSQQWELRATMDAKPNARWYEICP
ncbi:hypothetical protein POX_a01879 [Penicillium oxalicum]|uniref:hypothetical protein n=1 Tax=Penicillium oxalicum TaxID=69781 RepID=UPI0020B77D80|nr:hypothetical protein POX_a01879 [Penicillium oxalicum]KAI2795274.1 hypothetical protein POX_a01879 [Penicillium oxalicum]